MAGEVQALVEKLAKVRGEIGVWKMKLAQAEETERQLLIQILDMSMSEDDAGVPKVMNMEMALSIGSDVAILKIDEDWWDFSAANRHKAIDVNFVPCAPQGL
jgi:hypothetical protein